MFKAIMDVENETSMAQLTSEARGKLLGEQPLQKTTKLVFDLMSKDDRERITSTKKIVLTKTKIDDLSLF